MIRSISIEPVLNGFVLQVGCQKVVFSDTKQLASEIRKYYDDPEETEKSYIKNAVNKMSDIPPPCASAGSLGFLNPNSGFVEYPRTAMECHQGSLRQ